MYANTMPTHSKNKVLMSINLVSSGPAGEDLLWAQKPDLVRGPYEVVFLDQIRTHQNAG